MRRVLVCVQLFLVAGSLSFLIASPSSSHAHGPPPEIGPVRLYFHAGPDQQPGMWRPAPPFDADSSVLVKEATTPPLGMPSVCTTIVMPGEYGGARSGADRFVLPLLGDFVLADYGNSASLWLRAQSDGLFGPSRSVLATVQVWIGSVE